MFDTQNPSVCVKYNSLTRLAKVHSFCIQRPNFCFEIFLYYLKSISPIQEKVIVTTYQDDFSEISFFFFSFFFFRSSRHKLEELLKQWSEWHAQHALSAQVRCVQWFYHCSQHNILFRIRSTQLYGWVRVYFFQLKSNSGISTI